MSPTQSVIVYLARSSEQDAHDLCRSLTLLRRNFLKRFPYPVVVFVESSFKESWKKTAIQKSGVNCHFETIEFRIPGFLNHRAIPEYVYHTKFNIGYRHMCRFFSGMMYQEPVLKDYRWYWRLDTDSFILSPIEYDLFKVMEDNNSVYGYMVMSKDSVEVSLGLWELTRRYLEDNAIKPKFTEEFLPNGEWDRSYYYTNFEISSFEFWRSRPVQDYFNYVDRSGGIFKYRWGDALVHALAVSIFLDKDKTYCFKNIHYDHQGVFNAPKERAPLWNKIVRKYRFISSNPAHYFSRHVSHALQDPKGFTRKVARKIKNFPLT